MGRVEYRIKTTQVITDGVVTLGTTKGDKNMSEIYGELISLDNLHYAAVVADTTMAYTGGEVLVLAPAGEISHETTTNINKRYYDGKLRYVSIIESDTSVKITVSGIPTSLAATLTGKIYDSEKGILIDTGTVSEVPWFALSGRMELEGGGYRYFQYLKGKFSIGATSAATRAEDIDPKTTELTYMAVVTDFQFTMPDATTKGVKGITADTTDDAFVSSATWFSAVQTPDSIGAPTAVALSSAVPANNATNIAVTAKPVLTFNNVITDENISVIKATDNSLVTFTGAWDSTYKIYTITPSSNLAANTVYLIVVSGVIDTFGQKLATSIVKFTTAT